MFGRKLFFLLSFLGLIVFFLWYQNNHLTLSTYEFSADLAPLTESEESKIKIKTASADSFSLVHLSDLHNKSFGTDNKKLLEKIEKLNPDLVLITGDIIDSQRVGSDQALRLIEGLKEKTPVYFVPGNHERWSGSYPALKAKLRLAGAIILENEVVLLENQEGKKILLAGIDDPDFSDLEKWQNNLNDLSAKAKNYFTVLLSHRPERFEDYIAGAFDLTLAGHAHGGQWRLPFIGGLVAPNQGLLPKYDAGLYQKVTSKMVVSRGLGNSLAPLRLFNLPEIIFIKINF
ncbi:MAG: metallophosphoesterase [Patescibacteria group bacterium]|nr:metallophosphoesterase [Patescibacteria group bacterium]